MSSTIQWCDGPTPRRKRPSHAACTESACWPSAIGWRDCSGTTAVPSSMRLVSRPISATAVMASKSCGSCGIHAVANPASSAARASSTIWSTFRA